MNAAKNVTHYLVLLGWILVGAAFSLNGVFGAGASMASLAGVAGWWVWFVALAAVSTWLVSRCTTVLGAIGTHAALVVALACLPVFGPFAWIRYGFDAVRA